MKNFMLSLFFMLLACNAFSQENQEKIIIKVSSDSAVITDQNVLSNCCSIFIDTMLVEDNKITIIETDTSTQKCNCICQFDLTFSVHSLMTGDYTVEIYRRELMEFGYEKDTLLYIGSEIFTIIVPFAMPPVYHFFKQSDCTGLSVEINEKDYFEPQILPENTSNTYYLKYYAYQALPCFVEIFNIKGEMVFRTEIEASNTGYNITELFMDNLPKGIYYGWLIYSNGKRAAFQFAAVN